MLKKLTKNKLSKTETRNTNGGGGLLGIGWFILDLCDGYCYSHCGKKHGMDSNIKKGQDIYQK